MNKYLIFTLLISQLTILVASDFTVAKNVQVNQSANLKPAKKIKELILETISQILKNNLINLDRLLIDLRVYLQDEFELGVCGEHETLINSSSKSERQAYLDLVTQLNSELTTSLKKFEDAIKQLKNLNLKAGKLKG